MIQLYGKENLTRRLSELHSSGRFPHAVLLHGDDGVGKLTAAKYIAMLSLCEKGGDTPCGVCGECRRIESDIHPDVLFVRKSSDGEKYSVGEMRRIIEMCHLRPNDTKLRVIIFENAHEMRPDCQNTLLKFIEEPLPFNRCVFTADNASAILTTIISRVVSLAVAEPSPEQCAKALADCGVPDGEISGLIALYGGNIGKCLAGRENEDERRIFETVAEIVESIAAENEFLAASAFSKLSSRNALKEGLYLLTAKVNEAMKHSVGVHADKSAAALARTIPLKKLCAIAEFLRKTAAGCEFNPNIQLACAYCASGIFQIIQQRKG